MTPKPDWHDGEVVSFAAPLWIIAGVVLVFAIVGVVSTLNALTSPPPAVQCQRECCLREEDDDALDSASVVVHPATRPDPR